MRLLLPMSLIIALSACGDDKPQTPASTKDETKRSVTAELPSGVKASADVLKMRKIAGVWRSIPGALVEAPGQVLQMEIAFDNSFTMTLWGKDPKGKGPAVFARQAGKIGYTAGGMAGSASKPGDGAISSVASWTAAIDKSGQLALTPIGGKAIMMGRAAN